MELALLSNESDVPQKSADCMQLENIKIYTKEKMLRLSVTEN